MDDTQIIDLYWDRDQGAITATAGKYGSFLHALSWNILRSHHDAEECVNDTYMRAWNSIPPQSPAVLATFLGKITRNAAIDRLRARSREKRGGGETALALEELDEVIGDSETPETEALRRELTQALNRFLAALPKQERYLFVRRYWYLDSIRTLSEQTGFSESKTASMLYRLRTSLKKMLTEEELL